MVDVVDLVDLVDGRVVAAGFKVPEARVKRPGPVCRKGEVSPSFLMLVVIWALMGDSGVLPAVRQRREARMRRVIS